jgi:hypothetical protein
MPRSWRWTLPVFALLCLLVPLGTGAGLARADSASCSTAPAPIYIHPGRERSFRLFCPWPNSPSSVTFGEAEHGTVIQSTTWDYLYQPAAGYLGPDHFTLYPSDEDGAWEPIDVPLTVSDTLSTAPDCWPLSAGIVRDGETRNVHIQACFDQENDPVHFEVVTPPAHGTLGTPVGRTVSTHNTAQWPYTPDAGYSGSDSFTYHAIDDFGAASQPRTATITVYAADFNRPPHCSLPPPDLPLNGSIVHGPTTYSTFCFDEDEDPLTMTVVTPPAHGTLEFLPGDTLSYTPDAGYTGPDTLTYTASDGHGGVSSSLTRTLEIGPNHAPVCPDLPATITPRATAVMKPTTFVLPCTDSDGDWLTFVVDSAPAHGQLTYASYLQELTYTPDVGFAGQDVAMFHMIDNNGGVSPSRELRLDVGEIPAADDEETPPATESPVLQPPATPPPSAIRSLVHPFAQPAAVTPSAAVQAARLLGGASQPLNLGLGAAVQAFAATGATKPGGPLAVVFCPAGCTVAVHGRLVLGGNRPRALPLARRTLRVTPVQPGVLKLTLTKAQRARLARAKNASVVLTLKTTAGGKSKSVKRTFAIRR